MHEQCFQSVLLICYSGWLELFTLDYPLVLRKILCIWYNFPLWRIQTEGEGGGGGVEDKGLQPTISDPQ